MLCCGSLLLLSFGVLGYLWYSQPPSRELLSPVGKDYFTTRMQRSNRPEQAYRVMINVGSNRENLITSLIDTGSHKVWVQEDKMKCSPSLRVSEQDAFHVNYMGGMVTGDVAEDTLSIHNYSWLQTLGVAKQMTMRTGDFHSILGLGKSCADKTCAHGNWPLRSRTFAFFIDLDTGEGVFQAGWFNASECSGNMSFVPLVSGPSSQDIFWTVRVAMGSRANLTAVVDTGTSYVHLKPDLFEAFMGHVKQCDCQRSCLQDLSLKIGDQEFNLSADHYLISTHLRTCRLRIEQLDSRFPEDILLGASFLMRHYVVFDADNLTFGICSIRPSKSSGFSAAARGLWYDIEDSARGIISSFR